MIEDLRLRGRADNTINTYVPCVSRFFEWAGVTPTPIFAPGSKQDVRSTSQVVLVLPHRLHEYEPGRYTAHPHR